MECSGSFETNTSNSFVLCIILDLTFPTDGDIYKKCLEAVENVLAWAVYAPHRVSLVGVTSINSTPQHRLQFSPLGGSSSALHLLRGFFRTAGDSHNHVANSDINDSLFMTISKVALHLKERRRLEAGQLMSTVLTCRDGRILCDGFDGLPDDVARYFDAMQVVQLSTDPSTQPRFSVSGSARVGRPAVRLAVVPVDAAGAGRAALALLEAALRSAWFTPRASELLPLRLELGPLRGTRFAATALQCVASKCVLDLGRLPVGDHFALLADGGGGARAAGLGEDLRVLRAVSRVCGDGVCEGSLFGQPLRVTWSPPSAFQSQEHFQRNAHLFLALCESLADRDEQLVVKLQTGAQPTAASGHFLLMPGEECMLLRAVTSAELVLPLPPPPPMQYDGALAALAEQEACSALDALPLAEQYRAKDFPSGLCATLRLGAGFPQRLSLGKSTVCTPSGAYSGALSSPASTALSPPPSRACSSVPSPAEGSPTPATPPARNDVEVVQVLSSDDEEELPEVNDRPVSLGSSTSKRTASKSAPSHKLGTGGHPALQDDFGAPPAAPAKRKKFQPLHGVFKTRRN